MCKTIPKANASVGNGVHTILCASQARIQKNSDILDLVGVEWITLHFLKKISKDFGNISFKKSD